MTCASDGFVDLRIAGVIEGTVREEHLSPSQLLEMELCLMDNIAVKVAGGEHLVHWEAAGEYQ